MRLPAGDLDDGAKRLQRIAGGDLAGAKVVITGGSGFIGRWLVETFCEFDRLTGNGARIIITTRDAAGVRARAPHLAEERAVTLVESDVSALEQQCDLVIHAATDSAENLATREPRRFVEAIDATSRALEFAARAGARRFLYISSGAVYAKQETALIDETFAVAPDVAAPRSAYGESKRAGELLCALHKQGGLHVTIARLFSVIGPLIPLGPKFAAGQFLDDVLHRRSVGVRGDGTPLRSYLYAGDVATWLWTILLRGENGRAYNVGSETAVSIRELAQETAQLDEPAVPVIVHTAAVDARPVDRYVPSTQRARGELGLIESVDWRAALRKTFDWYRSLHDSRS
jgi:dTDP-glucose 4,6-dehydratase